MTQGLVEVDFDIGIPIFEALNLDAENKAYHKIRNMLYK